jgi:NADH-quinone oxidoreductase subunit J
MDLFLPYIASLTFALALFAALRPAPLKLVVLLITSSVAAAGWLLGLLVGSLSTFSDTSQGVFFIIFGLCAVACALRMVTHEKPVYSALYFVLVVLSTAGLFILLEAEFMAFALVIVYAGAILITYMFVLMLSNQTPDTNQPNNQKQYDNIPREPAAAVGVGFLLLCMITGTVISGTSAMPVQGEPNSKWYTLEQLPKQFESSVLAFDPSFSWPPITTDEGHSIRFDEDKAVIVSSDGKELVLPDELLPRNTQQVGWSLVNDFPVSLELAGVILLMAMFGAAVLARRAIELGDQEKRDALISKEQEKS